MMGTFRRILRGKNFCVLGFGKNLAEFSNLLRPARIATGTCFGNSAALPTGVFANPFRLSDRPGFPQVLATALVHQFG